MAKTLIKSNEKIRLVFIGNLSPQTFVITHTLPERMHKSKELFWVFWILALCISVRYPVWGAGYGAQTAGEAIRGSGSYEKILKMLQLFPNA